MAVADVLANLPNPGFAAGNDDFAEAKALVQQATKLDDRITLAGMELQAFPGPEQRQQYLNTLNYLSTTLRRVDGYGEPARVNKEGT
jgi:hypothetical protein